MPDASSHLLVLGVSSFVTSNKEDFLIFLFCDHYCYADLSF